MLFVEDASFTVTDYDCSPIGVCDVGRFNFRVDSASASSKPTPAVSFHVDSFSSEY